MGRKRSDREDERHRATPKKSTPVTRGPTLTCADCSARVPARLDDAFTPINHKRPDTGEPCNY